MGIFEVILAFMEKGGNVLWLIAALVFFMWTLIFERVWYFTSVWKADRDAVVSAWEGRSERKSWNAKKIRERLLSESRELINDNMNVIATCVALCPLLGLLGTVTGMIATFDIITEFGTGDPKMLSGGISTALITTQLGLIVAIPAVLLGNAMASRTDKVVPIVQGPGGRNRDASYHGFRYFFRRAAHRSHAA